MANLKVLFLHDEGFPAEVNPLGADRLTLPELLINGPVDLDSHEILNVSTPSESGSAANKGYVDAVASGLNPHESVVVKTAHKLGTQALLVGVGGSWTGALTTSDKFDVSVDGETAVTITLASAPSNRAATITAINTLYTAGGGTGGTIAYAGLAGQIDLRSPTWGSGGSVAVTNRDAVWGSEVGITQASAAGLDFTAAGGPGPGKTLTAPSTATIFNTLDGVTLAVDDRVLVSMEGGDDITADVDNGVYKVTAIGNGSSTSFTLERAADADQGVAGELIKGLYVFATGGTLSINTGWTMITAGAISPDVTPIKFSQFSGAPGYTYDRGLVVDVTSVNVELDNAADAQSVGLPSGPGVRKSGLEFDADSAAGKLRVAVAAAGGIQRNQSAGGIEVKLDAPGGVNTLSASATGLKVIGVPVQFYVGTVQTNNTVTGTNLNTLTGGGDASLLHTHGGATEAEKLEHDFTADGIIAKADPVYITTAGKVQKAQANTDAKAFAVGICLLGIADTASGPIVMDGIAAGIFASDQTIGTRYFIGATGGLVTTPPSGSGNHVMQMGFACAIRDFLVQKQYMGKKA
jgi:hypothetical protein